MFTNNFDPIAINFFIFDIRWYSLAYIFGILFGWVYIKYFIISEKKFQIFFDEIITYLIFGIIIGGRVGYALIYNLEYYIKHPHEILYIWEGGMSFHGGVIGIIFACYIFSKKKDENMFKFLDLVSLASPIGIFLGRISNYINSELYGRTTDLPWSVIFLKIDNLSRHPSQIYEAIFEGIILFIILNYIFIKSLHKPGVISALFLILYSIFRFLIEFTREPDVQIGLLMFDLSMGQIISILTMLFGVILLFYFNTKKKI